MGSLKKVPNSLVWLTVKAISLELLFQLKMHLNIKKISLPASLEAHRLEPVSETLSWQKHCHPPFFIPPFFYWMKCFSSRRCNPAFHQVSLRADWGGEGGWEPIHTPGWREALYKKSAIPILSKVFWILWIYSSDFQILTRDMHKNTRQMLNTIMAFRWKWQWPQRVL